MTRLSEPYRLYLLLTFASFTLFAAAFPMTLYETAMARLDPLQLVLVGTVLELSVLLFEVPTGVVADVFSRRLSVITGHAMMGLGFILESLFPSFLPILAAQVVWGVGYTFTSGATQAWLSDEIGEERANRAFLTANRYGMAGALLGVLASTALGSWTSFALPIRVAGAGRILLAVLLFFLMKERGFRPARPRGRHSFRQMADTFRLGLQAVRLRPSLAPILGVGLFYGLYSEGFDRLWIKHLLATFDLPMLFGVNDLAFFGLLRAAGFLLSVAMLRLVERRFGAGEPRTIGRLLLGITAGIAASIAAFAWSPLLGLSIGLYLVIFALREVAGPLMDAWVNQRLDPAVRATLLSMLGQVDAVGQISSGPAVGALGKALSVPVALSISGALLAPAIAFIQRARRTERLEQGTSER